jgi:hypothetical protein
VPPLLRRAIEAVAVFAIALAGVIALLLFFEGRDASTTAANSTPTASGPGIADPSATSALLRAGNVELRYGRTSDRNALVVFAQRQAGADTSALRAIGGAIVVVHDPKVSGVAALAYQRRLQPTSSRDPRLQAFVEAWLGQRR